VRILLASTHRYPASVGGLAGNRILDWLAKGLAELGQTVFYLLQEGAAVPLPEGIELVTDVPSRVDLIHAQDDRVFERLSVTGIPWVRTCHVDVRLHGKETSRAKANWIYVSRTLAQTYESTRYVINGINPSEYIYSEVKDDYFLFVAGLERAMSKGLQIALELSRAAGFPLVVAGSSWKPELVDEIAGLCRRYGARYVGEVYGVEKARLFAEAKALLFPTQWNESFGVVMAEALMSGTPVICSNHGACPELISPDVGFVCAHEGDYARAIRDLQGISPQACRAKALRDFHYLRMSADYIREYKKTIASYAQQGAEVS
jgi:glycosyltransferase involved in cell wall biosynthesis